MASSELNALTAATAATGGIYYGEQSGASRKFTVTAAGATLLEAANAAAQRTALGLATGDSPQFTALNIGHASDTTLTRVSAGVIAVEGSTILVSGGALGTPASGTLTSCTGLPISTGVSGLGTGVATALAAGSSTGGNGATDSGKVAVFDSTGGINFGTTTSGTTLVINTNALGGGLKINPYLAGSFGMDVTAHANTIQGYVMHGQGSGNVGVALDFTATAGTSTGFGVDFSGVGASTNTGLELTMSGAGNAIVVDGTVWTLSALGVMNKCSVTPAANATAITVNSATHTTNAPVLDAAQTWNAGGTTFTAVKLNVTNTTSAAGSMLMDLQVGSASKFNVTKAGLIAATSSLELYNTAIDGTNYEKLTIDWSSNVLRIAPRSGGTGTGRGMTVGANNLPGYGYIHFAANGNVGIGTTSPGSSYTFAAGDIEFSDTVNLKFATTTGTKIGTATSQKIGFFNATPVVQQTASTALTDNTTGNPGSDLGVCGDTSGSNQASVINNNFATVLTQLNTIRTALTNLGLAA